MNEKEAITIIEDMISKTQQEVKDNGFYYILWGWLVFISALIDYTLLVFVQEPQHALVWGILMPLGGLVSFIAGKKLSKKVFVKTYIDEALKALTIAFTASIFIVCVIMPMTAQNWQSFFPTLLVIYGFGIFVFGGIIRFNYLKYGAIANWILAIIGFYCNYSTQLILVAIAVLIGFIIPGHMLKARFKNNV